MLKIDLNEDGNDNQSVKMRNNTQAEFENQKISMGIVSKSSKSGQINYPAWVKTDPKVANGHNNKYAITNQVMPSQKNSRMLNRATSASTRHVTHISYKNRDDSVS